MTNRQMDNRMRKLAALEAERSALEDRIAALKDEIVEAMGDAEEVETKSFIVRFKAVISNRFDSKAFKADHEKLYKQYLKTSAYNRFSYVTK